MKGTVLVTPRIGEEPPSTGLVFVEVGALTHLLRRTQTVKRKAEDFALKLLADAAPEIEWWELECSHRVRDNIWYSQWRAARITAIRA